MNWECPNSTQYCSWILELQEYDFTIRHRKGEDHQNADALSRYPQCEQCQVNHTDPRKKRNTLRLQLIQEDSDAVTTFINILKQDKEISLSQLNLKQPELKYLWKNKERLIIKSNELFIRADEKLLKIPFQKEREKLINNIHDQLGHLGQNKCYSRIKLNYYWFNMEQEVKDIIRSCQQCQRYKPDHTKKQSYGHLNTKSIFDTLSLDIIGPFKQTPKGYSYLLGIIDNFSKYVMLCPLKTLTSLAIIQAVKKKWISIFGIPNKIHSDNHSVFCSENFKAFCKSYDIKKSYSAPYFPQSDGIIERTFKTIKPLIFIALESPRFRYWTDTINRIEIALRNTVSKTTGKTPSFLVFNRELRHIFDLKDHKIIDKENNENSNENDSKFTLGEKVLIKLMNKCTGSKCYDGPYKIIRHVGNKMYELQRNEREKPVIRSGRHLKKYYGQNELDDGATSIISARAVENRNITNDSTIQSQDRQNEAIPETSVRRYPRRQRIRQERYGYDI